MSRVGNNPVPVPSGVKVTVEGQKVLVDGPKGKLETLLPEGISFEQKEDVLVAKRANEEKKTKALHGLARTLVANSVQGVSEGFSKSLDVVGIGYRAEAKGRVLTLSVGFSHPIEFPVPEGIEVEVTREQRPTISNYIGTIVISGASKYLVGQVAADLRGLRPPDAYKGKGIRYSDEVVHTKVGKKGA